MRLFGFGAGITIGAMLGAAAYSYAQLAYPLIYNQNVGIPPGGQLAIYCTDAAGAAPRRDVKSSSDILEVSTGWWSRNVSCPH